MTRRRQEHDPKERFRKGMRGERIAALLLKCRGAGDSENGQTLLAARAYQLHAGVGKRRRAAVREQGDGRALSDRRAQPRA